MNELASSPNFKGLPMFQHANARVCRHFVLILLSSLLFACNKEKPMGNTPEYRAAHGVVEGQENTILVGKSKFHLPPEAVFDVYTSGDIYPHQADKLRLYINMAHALNVDPSLVEYHRPHKLGGYIVSAEIEYRRRFSQENSIFFSERNLSDPVVREDLSLIEYTRLVPPSVNYSRTYLYRSIEKSSAGLFPPYTEIHCGVAWPDDEAKKNGQCRMAYYMQDLVVESFFSYSLLLHWQVVLSEVSREVLRYKEQ